MGLRFRKTVSLGKGVRLNFAKSGVSTSVGPRGASVTFGKNGTYANIGLPGTGLSYRKRIGGSAANSRTRRDVAGASAIDNIASYTGATDYAFQTVISEKGEILFFDESGKQIEDKKLISLLRRHPQYLDAKDHFEAEALEVSRKYASQLQRDTESFVEIYRLSPKIKSEMDFRRHRSELRPKQYQVKAYPQPAPSKDSIRSLLVQDAEKNVQPTLPWKREEAIASYVDDRLNAGYLEAVEAWQREKSAYESSQDKDRREFEKKAEDRYRKSLRKLDAAISGNKSYIEWAVEKWMAKCTLPLEVEGSFDYLSYCRVLLVDLRLPNIDELPQTYAVQKATGAYSERRKPQKQLREEHAACNLGLMVYVAACLFNISPAISEIVMSGFLVGRNKGGSVEDQCVVSTRYTRAAFSQCDYAIESPEKTILKFENRLNLTATKIFKPVQPLQG